MMSAVRKLTSTLLIAAFTFALGTVAAPTASAQNTDRSRPFTPHPATEMERARLDEDRELLVSWLAGEWSSEEQIAFQEEAGIDEALRHPWHHDYYVRVDVPALGEYVLYTEKNIDGKVLVRQYWVLDPLYDSRVVENRIFIPSKETMPEQGAWQSPETLSRVDVETLRSMPPGCSTYWEKRVNHFDVEIQDECRVRVIDGFKAYHGARSAITEDTLLMYLFELNAKGEQVGGNPAGIPRILKKVAAP
ncbi:MAG: CpcT/CpeT family chromophore lyase [Rhodospirillaceae bacterium]|jgi:hypothetical protein|nr:CpcT/CpeT family chromophore lyase [Rhodospirillaceae bacterium]